MSDAKRWVVRKSNGCYLTTYHVGGSGGSWCSDPKAAYRFSDKARAAEQATRATAWEASDWPRYGFVSPPPTARVVVRRLVSRAEAVARARAEALEEVDMAIASIPTADLVKASGDAFRAECQATLDAKGWEACYEALLRRANASANGVRHEIATRVRALGAK